MKILFLSNLFPPYYKGGYELRCAEVANALQSRGHDVSIITSMHNFSSPVVDGHIYRVLRYIPDEITTDMFLGKIKRPWKYLAAHSRVNSISRYNARTVAKIISSTRPDVAYIWNLDDLTIAPLIPLHKNRIPCVFSLGERWLLKSLNFYTKCNLIRKSIRRLITNIANPELLLSEGTFLPNSRCLYDEHINAGLPPERVFILNRGVRVPKTIPALPDTRIIRILFAGRICEEKGINIAIQAAVELKKDKTAPQFELNIAGYGKEDEIIRLKQQIDTGGLTHKVNYLGHLSWEKLADLRHSHHIYIFPSIWVDPFPVVLLEAMAAGLPIIATTVGGAAEMLIDGVNALTVPPGDHLALAYSIKRLANDRDLMLKLREGGHTTVRERFDFDKLIVEHEKYLLTAGGSLGKS